MRYHSTLVYSLRREGPFIGTCDFETPPGSTVQLKTVFVYDKGGGGDGGGGMVGGGGV